MKKPTKRPYFCTAFSIYTEHVGVKMQSLPISGERVFLYIMTNAFTTFFMFYYHCISLKPRLLTKTVDLTTYYSSSKEDSGSFFSKDSDFLQLASFGMCFPCFNNDSRVSIISVNVDSLISSLATAT